MGKSKQMEVVNQNQTNPSDEILDEINQLIQLMGQTDLAELEIEVPNLKIVLRKNSDSKNPIPQKPKTESIKAVSLPTKTTQTIPVVKPLSIENDPAYYKIIAPMAGTFYRAPSPALPPYVKEGDQVFIGQPVCIVEAMKLMNEIKAEKSGKVIKILAENSKPVEKGKILFVIEPKN